MKNYNKAVVAERWDGLGARLAAIVNAYSVARTLDLQFRFVWPRDREPKLTNPVELFHEKFLSEFEILRPEQTGVVSDFNPAAYTIGEARTRFSSVPTTGTVIKISECYNILGFADEDADRASARFRDCFRTLGWSDEIRKLIEFFDDWHNEYNYSAIHIRYGDIVFGAWRHVMAHEKYVPTPFVCLAIEKLSRADHKPVLITSDNDDYLGWLKQRYHQVHTPGDFFPSYMNLSSVQRAFVDLLALSRCDTIVAPPRSAFSRLAANLGAVPIVRADGMAPKQQEFDFLARGIQVAMQDMANSKRLRSLLARDICWYLDVFGESLAISEQIAWARRAVDLDPDFSGARCRVARIAALIGNRREARRLSRRALKTARLNDRHADPLVEAISTVVAVDCLAIAERLRMERITRLLATQFPQLFGFCRRLRYRSAISTIKRTIGLCTRRAPYWLDCEGILNNLRYQIAAIERLLNGNVLWAHQAAIEISRTSAKHASLSGFRESGLHWYQSSKIFDPVLRDLERVTVRLADAIGRAMIDDGKLNHHMRARGGVDGIFRSSSGLQWIYGWALDSSGRSDLLAVGFAHEGSVYGGPTFIPRPDVEEAFKNPEAIRSGFALPIPLDVCSTGGSSMSNFVALTTTLELQKLL